MPRTREKRLKICGAQFVVVVANIVMSLDA
jgi:hypothetical protein